MHVALDWNARCAETSPLEAFRRHWPYQAQSPNVKKTKWFANSSTSRELISMRRWIFVSIDGMFHNLGRTMHGGRSLRPHGQQRGRDAGLHAWHLHAVSVLTRENLVAQRYGDYYPVLGTRCEVCEFRENLSKALYC